MIICVFCNNTRYHVSVKLRGLIWDHYTTREFFNILNLKFYFFICRQCSGGGREFDGGAQTSSETLKKYQRNIHRLRNSKQKHGSGPNNRKQDEILATVHRSKMEGKPTNSRSRSRLYFTLNSQLRPSGPPLLAPAPRGTLGWPKMHQTSRSYLSS